MTRRAYPGNGNVSGCEWYLSSSHGGSRHITVHLWGRVVAAEDSHLGESWTVRSCVVCGTLDQAWLLQQYTTKEAHAPE